MGIYHYVLLSERLTESVHFFFLNGCTYTWCEYGTGWSGGDTCGVKRHELQYNVCIDTWSLRHLTSAEEYPDEEYLDMSKSSSLKDRRLERLDMKNERRNQSNTWEKMRSESLEGWSSNLMKHFLNDLVRVWFFIQPVCNISCSRVQPTQDSFSVSVLGYSRSMAVQHGRLCRRGPAPDVEAHSKLIKTQQFFIHTTLNRIVKIIFHFCQ